MQSRKTLLNIKLTKGIQCVLLQLHHIFLRSDMIQKNKTKQKNNAVMLFGLMSSHLYCQMYRSSGFCTFQVGILQSNHSDQQSGNSLKYSAWLTQEFQLGFGPYRTFLGATCHSMFVLTEGFRNRVIYITFCKVKSL